MIWIFILSLLINQLLCKSKNIILLIADGMGLETLSIINYHNKFVKKGNVLNYEQVAQNGNISITYTYSASHPVPDSAAAGTTIACGVLTKNRMIGMGPDSIPVTNLLQIAKGAKKSVGIVTTTSLTHATPAAFSSHVDARGEVEEIVKQQMGKNIDLMFGGGRRFYDQEQLEKLKYKIIFTRSELKKIDPKKVTRIFGLFAEEHMNYRIERTPEEPSLPEMTEFALKFLSKDEDGFFLVVESGRIDHAGHKNSIKHLLAEIYEFDETISVINSFIKNSPDTTVVITSDHSTGAPIFLPEATIKKMTKEFENTIEFCSEEHTSIPVLTISYGKNRIKKNIIHLKDIFEFIKSEI